MNKERLIICLVTLFLSLVFSSFVIGKSIYFIIVLFIVLFIINYFILSFLYNKMKDVDKNLINSTSVSTSYILAIYGIFYFFGIIYLNYKDLNHELFSFFSNILLYGLLIIVLITFTINLLTGTLYIRKNNLKISFSNLLFINFKIYIVLISIYCLFFMIIGFFAFIVFIYMW